MRDTLQFNSSEEVLLELSNLINKHGDITIEAIYPPGTPISEISLAHTQETSKKYVVKITYGV